MATAQLARVEVEAEAGRLRESNETLKAALAAKKLARVDDAARIKADADTRTRESATQLRLKKEKQKTQEKEKEKEKKKLAAVQLALDASEAAMCQLCETFGEVRSGSGTIATATSSEAVNDVGEAVLRLTIPSPGPGKTSAKLLSGPPVIAVSGRSKFPGFLGGARWYREVREVWTARPHPCGGGDEDMVGSWYSCHTEKLLFMYMLENIEHIKPRYGPDFRAIVTKPTCCDCQAFFSGFALAERGVRCTLWWPCQDSSGLVKWANDE